MTIDVICDQQRQNPDELLVIVGPTASGKTALAIAIAEKVNGEIVSADSVQIYRHFDRGSGKPSQEEVSRVRHHLIGAVDPMEAMDTARFVNLADEQIADIRSRGKQAIVCGGTFLWVKALTSGLAQAPQANEDIRERHRAIVLSEGARVLHDKLSGVDPKAALKLHVNDVLRVSRALEVFEQSGKTMTQWHEDHAFKDVRYRATLIGIRHTPEELTGRIESRVRAFLESGLEEEVRDLIARGFENARAMGSVGYKETRDVVNGILSRDELCAKIVQNTRIFARRQRTWLNHENVRWLNPQDVSTQGKEGD